MNMARSANNAPIFERTFRQTLFPDNKKLYKMTGLAGAVMGALYPAGPAFAQDESELDKYIEEVIVTATKREVNLQDVPQSITAFTTVDIEKNAFKDMTDYVRALPSLSIINFRPGRNEIVFRGISTGTGEYRTDSQAAVYLDEQPLTTNSQQVWPYSVDIERVESLPGPQGTLFGSSSQSGTIRIITNKPNTDGFEGQVFGELRTTDGGDPGYEANGWVNIPLVEDKLALRLVAYGNKTGGWVDNVFGEDYVGFRDNANVVENDFNEAQVYGGRASLKWNISDNWEMLATVIAENNDTDGSWDSDPYLGDNKTTKFFDEYTSDDWYQAAITFTGDLGFATLVSNTAYFDREIAYEWDNMNYEQWKDSYWGYYYPLYNTEYTFGTIFNDQHQDRFSQEIRLTSQSESRFQWMVGLFYEDVYDEWYYGAQNPDLMSTIGWEAANYYAYWWNYYYNYDIQYPLAPTIVGYSNTFRRSIKQTAVFGEISYQLTDAWTATLGARWFEYDRDEFDNWQFPEGLPPFGSVDTDGSYIAQGKESDTVFKFSLQWDVTEDFMSYFLFSQGFRLGGFNSKRAADTGLVPLQFLPDKMDNWEIGFKSRWLDGKLQLNATAFLMEWEDIQLNNEGGVDQKWWLRGIINGETGENKGIEAEMTWWLTDSLLFQGSLTLTDPEYTKEFTRVDGSVVPAGTVMPISPDEVLWFAVEYNFANWKPFDGNVWLRYDQNYTSAQWTSLDNAINEDPEGRLPSWSIANFQAGLALPSDWTFTFFIRNIWNEKAMAWLSNGGNYQSDWFGDPRWRNVRSYYPPRTIGLNVRKSF